jgi:peptide/nickel transport system substrate-binding protein
MGRKCKTGFAKNPCIMKETKGNALPYLEAVAITFTRQAKWFSAIHTRKIRFTSGLDPSYKDEILTQKGELQPDYNEVNLITGPYLNTEYLGFRMDGDNKAALDLRIKR